MATTDRDRRRPPAKKRFGQHFLEPAWADKVVRAIAPATEDDFVEVGPGRGAITMPLAALARRVVAFEIDRDAVAALRARDLPRVEVIERDFLTVSGGDVRASFPAITRLRAAGNLPYNVASPILFKLVELYAAGVPLVDATVMLQKEVADRLLASPGTKEYGVLTVLIGHRARIERLLTIPPGAFRPVPKIYSALVRLTLHPPQPAVTEPAIFEALTQAIFTRRRKTLANAMHAYAPLTGSDTAGLLRSVHIAPERRPETLSIAELAGLSDAVARFNPRP